MALEWTEKLAVGYAIIDRQHQELFRRFGNLLDACQQRRGREEVESLIGFLDDYVISHFREEERLMDLHAYPRAEEHKSEHRYFIGRLGLLKQGLQTNGPSSELVISTNQTLLNWVIKHIKSIDVQLGSYLRMRTAPPL